MSKRSMLTSAIAWLVMIVFGSFGHQKKWLGATLPFRGAAFAQSQAESKPPMADAVFKNVQVLKGIPVDEFMGTMGLFSAALTVCCGDCHTGAGTSHPKWEDDPPRKQIARRMVRMVNAINKENFGGRQVVTCWTCHRGTPNPAVTPTIDTIYGEPVIVPPDIILPASASAGVPTVDQILDKYIQALGGVGRLTALTSHASKGTSKLFGEDRTDPIEVYANAPNQLATIIHQREGDLARTFDGRDAWVMLPLTVVPEYPLSAGALEGAKLDAQLAFPARIKQFFTTWRVGFPATLNSRDVYVLQGTGTAGLIATLYFDKQTGLLTRVTHYVRSAVGRVPTQTDYADYRPVAGVMMPFQWTYSWVSGREEYTLAEVQPNVSIDAVKFARPGPRTR